MNRDCKYDMHVWGTTVLNTDWLFVADEVTFTITVIIIYFILLASPVDITLFYSRTVTIFNSSISLAYSISYVTQQGS